MSMDMPGTIVLRCLGRHHGDLLGLGIYERTKHQTDLFIVMNTVSTRFSQGGSFAAQSRFVEGEDGSIIRRLIHTPGVWYSAPAAPLVSEIDMHRSLKELDCL